MPLWCCYGRPKSADTAGAQAGTRSQVVGKATRQNHRRDAALELAKRKPAIAQGKPRTRATRSCASQHKFKKGSEEHKASLVGHPVRKRFKRCCTPPCTRGVAPLPAQAFIFWYLAISALPCGTVKMHGHILPSKCSAVAAQAPVQPHVFNVVAALAGTRAQSMLTTGITIGSRCSPHQSSDI